MPMSTVDQLRMRTRHQNELELDRLRTLRASLSDDKPEAAKQMDTRMAALEEALKTTSKAPPVLSMWHYAVIAIAAAGMLGLGFMAVVAMGQFVNAQ